MQQHVRDCTPEKLPIRFRTKLEYELMAQALYLLQQTMNLSTTE